MHGLAQKADLLPIPTAPTANQQVKSQAQALGKGKIFIQSVGLEPGDLAAGRHDGPEACFYCRAQALENLHLTTVFLAF